MMNILELIGLILVLSATFLAMMYILYWIFRISWNLYGKIFDPNWHFIEFVYYRKQFLEWVKDK